MKKIIGILSVFLLPIVTFAQNYGFKMMDYNNMGYGNEFTYGHSLWFLPFVFIFPVIGIFLAVAIFIFWVMMLIDAIKHSPEKLKIVWVLVIIFTHIVGSFIYYFVEKRPRDKAKIVHHTEHRKEDSI